jgi:sigma-B regulation protein RsbQ
VSQLERLNVRVSGPASATPIVFAHGFGCGQEMWRHVAPTFTDDHRVVLFDLPGSGSSDLTGFDPAAYADLDAYARDVVEMLRELEVADVVLVGHSVSTMIGVLVHLAAPELVSRLVLVTPSARYLDDDTYRGGFTPGDIDDLLNLMSHNHLGWQDPLAGMVSGGVPEVNDELVDSFCRTRPDIARQFAEVTFRGDNRDDLPLVTVPTLVVQASDDAIAPPSAIEFVVDAIPDARLAVVETRGHCPHLSAPADTTEAIRSFLRT